MRPDTTRVWFIPQDTPYFYWLIPESSTQGALGLIGAGPPVGPSAHRPLAERGEENRKSKIESRQSHDPPTARGEACVKAEVSSTRRLLERFIERLGLTPLEFQAARIPVYTGWVPVRRRFDGGQV